MTAMPQGPASSQTPCAARQTPAICPCRARKTPMPAGVSGPARRMTIASSVTARRTGTPSSPASWGLVRPRHGGVDQRRGPGRAGGDLIGPLPQALQRFAVAERDRGLQPRAFPDLGQVHDGVDQARPAARRDVPGRGAQRRRGGSMGLGGSRHVSIGNCLIAVLDLDVPGCLRVRHAIPPRIRPLRRATSSRILTAARPDRHQTLGHARGGRARADQAARPPSQFCHASVSVDGSRSSK